ncbi:MAG: FtsW/RodA/SpoVE family cell cycle protein [Coprococcus sp.]|nr:FtsW/RodA/SpoVE family cell cycle protein [Coprococcus sp.]
MGNTAVMENTSNKTEYTPGTIYKLIIAMTFLIAFGLVMIFSASSSGSASENFMSQVKNIVLGLVGMLIFIYLPYGILQKFAWLLYGLSAACIALLKTGLGVKVNGATRWIELPIVHTRIQIADVVKLLLIIFIASYISSKWREMDKALTIFFLWVVVGLQAFALLIISNNLSSFIVIMGICYGCTFLASRNWKLHLFTLGFVLLVGVIFIAVSIRDLPTEKEILDNENFRSGRIIGWLYTEKYAQSVGYQVIQSLYAIGSGSFLGKGLGNGTQKLDAIPEAQNDMIFAIICEELGVVGAIMLFMIYGYLLYQLYVIVMESKNIFGSMIVIGVMIHIVCQVVINVGVATNILPNTGVTLPFISSGGSALITIMAECGLCIGIRRQQVKRIYQKSLRE